MSMSLRRVGILTAVAAMAAAFMVAVSLPAGAASSHSRSYLVTVENLTETQLLTPAVVATHSGNARVSGWSSGVRWDPGPRRER